MAVMQPTLGFALTLWLSWTAANRYSRCPKLQQLHKDKQTPPVVDQRVFHVGRVTHGCFERWLAEPDKAMVDWLNVVWAKEEDEARGHLPWDAGQRASEWVRAADVLVQLEADARRLELHRLVVHAEQRYRVELTEGLGCYAQPDWWAEHPSAPLLYVGELKSGSTYDPAQAVWYAMVLSIDRARRGLPYRTPYAVALRPACVPSVSISEITREAMQEQLDRVLEVGTLMLANRWEPTPCSYCAICEGRNLCPAYQAIFGRLNRKGRVGFGG